jgi:hypothetical protein
LSIQQICDIRFSSSLHSPALPKVVPATYIPLYPHPGTRCDPALLRSKLHFSGSR